MKVKILRNTIAAGHPVFAGGVEDLDQKIARDLIAAGKARHIDPVDTTPSVSELQNAYKGRAIAILGGGPSLPADLKKIGKEKAALISVNHHATKLADCDIMVFFDDPAKNEALKEAIEKFDGTIVTPHGDYATHVLDVQYVNYGMTAGLAVWIAEYLGAKEIFLCGMDCYTGSQTYFHTEGQSQVHDLQMQLDWWKKLVGQIKTPIRVLSGPLIGIIEEYKPKPARGGARKSASGKGKNRK